MAIYNLVYQGTWTQNVQGDWEFNRLGTDFDDPSLTNLARLRTSVALGEIGDTIPMTHGLDYIGRETGNGDEIAAGTRQAYEVVAKGSIPDSGSATWWIIKGGNGETYLIGATSPSGDATQAQNGFNENGTPTELWNFSSQMACFVEGTCILTRNGYREVEALAPGDEVMTLSGDWEAVRWVGRSKAKQRFTGLVFVEDMPVRISRDALGAGLPARDLLVSPDHAVFFRDHLIPAKSLINGNTVRRETGMTEITYFHVLLDHHAVIFSEALPTESYSPADNERAFENADSMPADMAVKILPGIGTMEDCFPRVARGPLVETARAYLANLAPKAELGQAA